MLAHDNSLAGVLSFHGIIKPMEHRLVSLLPLSHSLEQAVFVESAQPETALAEEAAAKS